MMKKGKTKMSKVFDLDYRPEDYFPAPQSIGEIYEEIISEGETEVPGFVPKLEPGEVAIASIFFDTVQGDLISVRAKQDGGLISYSVVDDYYDTGTRYKITPVASTKPLTMGELVEAIDTARMLNEDGTEETEYGKGLVKSILENNEYELSCEVTSDYYPELESYYKLKIEEWKQERIKESEEEADVKPPRKEPSPKILRVIGAKRRGVWLHIYHTYYEVETDKGVGTLTPEKAGDKYGLKVGGHSWSVKLTKTIQEEVKEYSAEYERLKNLPK